MFNALNMPATTSVKDDLGAYSLVPTTWVGIEVINPIAQTENTFNEAIVDKFSGGYGLNYNITDHLSAESRFQFNYAAVNSKYYAPEVYYGGGKVFN